MEISEGRANIVMLFCLYNHSQQLEERVDGTSTSPRNPIQEEGNYYKKGGEGDRMWRGGAETPITQEALEKAPRTVPKTNPF